MNHQYRVRVPFTEKLIRFGGVRQLGARQMKLYYVHAPQDPIESEVELAALEYVPSLIPEPDDETPAAGFAVVHRNRQGAFVDAYSWVWSNVIECRTAAAGVLFLGCPSEDPTIFAPLNRPWIGCVWELAPFGFERSAWVRHILDPVEPDLSAYLSDRYPDGLCGGPE